MANVTVSSTGPIPQRHIMGDLAMRTFKISGISGSTLPTGMANIQFYIVQQSTAAGTISLITAVSVAGGTLTFTSSGPMVNEVVAVFGREG